jgi:peptide chain release factor subunit 1
MTATLERSTPPTLGALMERFAKVGATDHWVVSCYLKLEPRDRSRGKYLIKLKNRIKSHLAWLEQADIPRAEREVVARDLERVREYLADVTNLPTGRGIAVFACEPLGLFEPIPLPAVFRSRLAIDRSPLVRELAALDDEFGLVLCVVYDRTSARFFRVTAFGIAELPGLVPGETTRAGRFHGPRSVPGPGSLASAGEHNYHRRMEAEKDRHYADIAERLFDLYRDENSRGIALASSGSVANALLPHLHPYVRKAVLGTTKLNPKTATAAEVMGSVLEVRRQSEREWEAEHIRELNEGIGTGWAVNGIDDTLSALSKGQVRTLLVDPRTAQAGFRCAATGRLTTRSDDCEHEGVAGQLPDVVDEAIEEALRQGGHVDVIEDKDAQGNVKGLAALLRFTGS